MERDNLSLEEINDLKNVKKINKKVNGLNHQTARTVYSFLKQNEHNFHTKVKMNYAYALIDIVKGKTCKCVLCGGQANVGDTFCQVCSKIDFQKLEQKKRRNIEDSLEGIFKDDLEEDFQAKKNENLNEEFDKMQERREKKSRDSENENKQKDFKSKSESNNYEDSLKKGYRSIVKKVNDMTGEKGEVKFRIRDLYTSVFRHHTTEEAENIFIAGTERTTPLEKDISDEWPKPWLYSRVLLYLVIAYVLLYILVNEFGNTNGYPGMMIVGAMSIPFSVMIFFWEINVPRNISLLEISKVFLIGGVLSLLCTLVIDSFLPIYELDYQGALLTGFAEETAKGIVLVLFLRKPKHKYILNGLLIGSAVGAGFAVFETAGYAFNEWSSIHDVNTSIYSYIYNIKLDNLAAVDNLLTLRSVLAVGGHVTWSAFVGAGIMVVKKNAQLSRVHLFDPRFLKFLFVAILLHGAWDSPLVEKFPMIFQCVPSMYIGLCVLIWFFILIVISAGLRQATRVANDARKVQENR